MCGWVVYVLTRWLAIAKQRLVYGAGCTDKGRC